MGVKLFGTMWISTHALREEGDSETSAAISAASNFYPRPPRGGRQLPVESGSSHRNYFYPRPPRGGRLTGETGEYGGNQFLPTPSARRATDFLEDAIKEDLISTHALREEGD